MIIHYKINKDDECLTSYPYNQQGFNMIRFVGSHMCSVCRYHLSQDFKNLTVLCSYDFNDFSIFREPTTQ